MASVPSVLTLNISRPPVDRAKAILEYLWQREEAILVLTEVGRSAGSELIASVCRAAGHSVHSSFTHAAGRRRDDLDRAALGVLVVGRDLELRRVRALPDLAMLPERLIALEAAGDESLRVIGVYGAASDPVRYASSVQRQRKRDWLLAFCGWLAELEQEVPTLLAGDLNVVAPGHRDHLPYVLPEERAAYDLITGPLGYRDVIAESGLDDAVRTWVDHSGVGCRYDYALTSAGMPAGVARIDPIPLAQNLSDHAALSWRP